MNKTVEIVLLGLLLSVPFMHGMERREVPVECTPVVGLSLLGMPDELRKLILSHLCASQGPVRAIKSLLSLRMTCREWNKYLNDDRRLQVFVYKCFGQQNLEKLFFDAAKEGNIEGMKVLLNAGINIDSRDDNGQRTALMVAACDRHTDVVRLLLEGGADVNAKNNHGRTALHGAARIGNINVVQLLLAQESINPNIQCNGGETALMTVLLYYPPDMTAIHLTESRYSHIEVAKLLLNIGVDLNLQDNSGNTALHCAAYIGNINVYQLLLAQESIDPSIQNNAGNTALMTARCYIKGLLTAPSGSAILKEH